MYQVQHSYNTICQRVLIDLGKSRLEGWSTHAQDIKGTAVVQTLQLVEVQLSANC